MNQNAAILIKCHRLNTILPFILAVDFCLIFLLVLQSFGVIVSSGVEEETDCRVSALTFVSSAFSGYALARFLISAFRSYDQVKLMYGGRSKTEVLQYVCTNDLVVVFITIVIPVFKRDCGQKNYLYALVLTLLLCLVFSFVTACFVENDGMSSAEIDEMCESHNLSVAYGASAAYFYNYLQNFIPHIFKERVHAFSKTQQVKVVEKLVILFPKSCVVKSYIDEVAHIERARELLPYELDIAGVKKRVYNITVYYIRTSLDRRGFWCPIEYAQPLRQIRDLKNSGKISEVQMHQQRNLCKQYLEDFLDQNPESKEACLLLSYDDTASDFNFPQCLYEACAPYMEDGCQ